MIPAASKVFDRTVSVEQYDRDLEVLAKVGELLARSPANSKCSRPCSTSWNAAGHDPRHDHAPVVRRQRVVRRGGPRRAQRRNNDLRYRCGEGIIGSVVESGPRRSSPAFPRNRASRIASTAATRTRATTSASSACPSRWAARWWARCRSTCRCQDSRAARRAVPVAGASWPA